MVLAVIASQTSRLVILLKTFITVLLTSSKELAGIIAGQGRKLSLRILQSVTAFPEWFRLGAID